VVPYADDDGAEISGKTAGRPIEAEALARYLRWLLAQDVAVRDPDTGDWRPLRAGDIAVLATATTQVRLLLAELDRLGIAYTARGGHLFLGHPVVRRMLLALRALADRDDGVAAAALLSPPFFALEPADLFAARRSADDAAADPELAARVGRVTEARAIIGHLRHARSRQSPGATARDLIELTGLGRQVVCGPNGRQILAALYEVAFELDRLARVEGIDFDAATVKLRQWAERPIYHDAPDPLDDRAVQVMSIHQAKGLEFPVVVLWDGYVDLPSGDRAPWMVSRDGGSWALRLEQLQLNEPPGDDLSERHNCLRRAERRRLYYVAATRARDLLVLPLPHRKRAAKTRKSAKPYEFGTGNIYLIAALHDEIGEELQGRVRRLEVYCRGQLPSWARDGEVVAPEPAAPDAGDQQVVGTDIEIPAVGDETATGVVASPELGERLAAARAEVVDQLERASQPVAVPQAISRAAARVAGAPPPESDIYDDDLLDEQELDDAELVWEPARAREEPPETARHGPDFGTTVHRALQLLLTGVCEAAPAAVAMSAAESGLSGELLDEARRDVDNALGVLEREGLLTRSRATEHPVVFLEDGHLLSGVIDLLLFDDDEVLVIDYKTDKKRPGSVAAAYPQYAAQLELYGRALAASGLLEGRRLRLGLLLTERGELGWLDR